jgi:tricorn protease-like protein
MERRVPSRLPDPPWGVAVYRSNPEDHGQLVRITFQEGMHVAEVMGGEDAGLVIVVRDMQEPVRA